MSPRSKRWWAAELDGRVALVLRWFLPVFSFSTGVVCYGVPIALKCPGARTDRFVVLTVLYLESRNVPSTVLLCSPGAVVRCVSPFHRLPQSGGQSIYVPGWPSAAPVTRRVCRSGVASHRLCLSGSGCLVQILPQKNNDDYLHIFLIFDDEFKIFSELGKPIRSYQIKLNKIEFEFSSARSPLGRRRSMSPSGLATSSMTSWLALGSPSFSSTWPGHCSRHAGEPGHRASDPLPYPAAANS